MRRLENKVFFWQKEKEGRKLLGTSTEIYWWVGKYITDPEPTRNSTLGVRLALLSWFNPSVLRSDRKQWQYNWQVLIAWFVLDQYQRYEQKALNQKALWYFLLVAEVILWEQLCSVGHGWVQDVLGAPSRRDVSSGVRWRPRRVDQVGLGVPAWPSPGAAASLMGRRSSGLQHVSFWGIPCVLIKQWVEVSGAVKVTLAKITPLFVQESLWLSMFPSLDK